MKPWRDMQFQYTVYTVQVVGYSYFWNLINDVVKGKMKESGGWEKDIMYLLRSHCLQPSSHGRQSSISASATSPDKQSK